MDQSPCPVCGSPLKLEYRLRFNVYECANCGLQHSDAQLKHSFPGPTWNQLRGISGHECRKRLKNFDTIIHELQVKLVAGETEQQARNRQRQRLVAGNLPGE